VRAGITGGADVEVVVTGCVGGTAFGRGGMYGVSFSPPSAVFAGTAGEEMVELATLFCRIVETAAAASGRGAGTGAGGLAEFPTAASGLGAGTGTCVVTVGFPAGSTPTGRLDGRGGGGPRLAKPGGSAGGILAGGGGDAASVSSSLTESHPASQE